MGQEKEWEEKGCWSKHTWYAVPPLALTDTRLEGEPQFPGP